jgi:hypothetical protein
MPAEAAPVAAAAAVPVQDAAKPAEAAAAPAQAAAEKANAERFASLAKRERALVERQQEIKAKESELSKAQEALKSFEGLKGSARTNLPAYLEAAGLSPQDVVNYVLNDGKGGPETEIKSVKDEIAKLRKERDDERRQATESEKKRLEQAQQAQMDGARKAVVADVEKAGDKFELINVMGLQGEVFSRMLAHFQKTQEVLTTEKAAEEVQSQLLDLLDKATKSKAWQSRLEALAAEAAKKPSSQGSDRDAKRAIESAQRRTLTNDLAATSTATIPAKRESEQDRIARAVAAFNAARQAK